MKDQLGDDPPTIGDCRRLGMKTFSAHCGAPCGHKATIAFDDLRLHDTVVFLEIPRHRRLVCRRCGRQPSEISASWNEVSAHGDGKTRIT